MRKILTMQYFQYPFFIILSLTATLLFSSHAQTTAQSSDEKVQLLDDKPEKKGWGDMNASWGKRNWDKLQGVWGKRSEDMDTLDELNSHEGLDQESKALSDFLEQEMNKRNWNKMVGAWGKRNMDETDVNFDDIDKRNWAKLQGAWGKRDEDQSSSSDEWNDEKRGWNRLQGAWGKRSLVQDTELFNDKRGWDRLQGAWGKRSIPSWNDEMSKRSWSNLRGSWGKRELLGPAGKGNEWSRKRESGWNNLKGLWG